MTASTSSTHASPPASNSTTSPPSSASSSSATPTHARSPTSAVASTLSARASKRYWNWRLKVAYDLCTLPTKTGFAGSHSISSSSFSPSTVRKSSWTHTRMTPPLRPSSNSPKTCLPSSPFLALASTASAAPATAAATATSASAETPAPRKRQRTAKKPPPGAATAEEASPSGSTEPKKRKAAPGQRQRALDGQLRTFKVRMVLTAAQRKTLKECFAAARWAYNEAVAAIRQGARPNFVELRNALVKVKGDARPPCAHGVHNKILARAVKQACDAYQTNYAKMRAQGKAYKFEVNFRSLRRTSTEVLVLERGKEGPVKGFDAMAAPAGPKRRHVARTECLMHLGGESFKGMGGVRLQDHDEVIARIVSEGRVLQEDGKIKWDKRTDSFHFVYTYVMPVPEDPDPGFENKRILSGDLGVAPFLQWYQPDDGSHGACLEGIQQELEARCGALDALHSRVDRRKTAHERRPVKHRARPRDKRRKAARRLRKRLARERVRLHNWVEGAHYDAANFLLERADVLVVPRIASQRMSERETRSIRSRTVRTMLTLSPGAFCERLASKAAAYAGRHVLLHTGEPGTSKTASCCGWFNWNLKVGDKECACPRCGVTIDRQVNGARGNLLAALGVALKIGWDGASG